jgi:prepilin-type N-terminal cleavage/methylation domain-containing protein
MRQPRRGQGGFTMIEVMIVVAVIAILAAVVIPSWLKEGRKGKADPEIRAMFSEISIKEEQYKSEQGGSYLALPLCPNPMVSSGTDMTTGTCFAAADWKKVNVAPTETTIRCNYVVTVGAAGVTPTVTGTATGFTLPSNVATYVSPWYYIVGQCDMDGQGGTLSTFFTASWDQSIQKQNYGS